MEGNCVKVNCLKEMSGLLKERGHGWVNYSGALQLLAFSQTPGIYFKDLQLPLLVSVKTHLLPKDCSICPVCCNSRLCFHSGNNACLVTHDKSVSVQPMQYIYVQYTGVSKLTF